MAITMKATLYPWLQETWQRLQKDKDRMPHALLLSGAYGLGKYRFASLLAQSILCSETDQYGFACGRCKNCQLFAAQSHPDFQLISPEEKGKAIIVDQIRAWINTVTLRPHIAAMKATVIHPADVMNHNAANCLLKMLEEPPLGNVLILVGHQPERLPTTVRSRCRWIKLPIPSRQMALEWLQKTLPSGQAELLLQQAHGAPLYAQQLHEDEFMQHRDLLLGDLEDIASQQKNPVACADHWQKIGALRCIRWFQGLLADMVKFTTTGDSAWLVNPDMATRLHALSKGLHLKELFQLSEKIAETGKLLNTPLDERLLLEDSLICWLRLYRNQR
ncbi:MAG: DNA polymerase III subunit delta' [Gammaproteobacteria bacterium]|nr:MAG: DNA polymerase III subunit delta' [Gammaproteobacteria bacterium]